MGNYGGSYFSFNLLLISSISFAKGRDLSHIANPAFTSSKWRYEQSFFDVFWDLLAFSDFIVKLLYKNGLNLGNMLMASSIYL